MTTMWKEFRAFIIRGNVVDLAIAFIVGGAFNKVVSSLVNDIIMPPIGLLLGPVNFQNLFINLSRHHYSSIAAAQKAQAPTLNYGSFLQNIVDFIIIAIVVYFMIEKTNRHFKKRETEKALAPVPPTKTCDYCFTSIPVQATRCPNCTSVLATVHGQSE